MSTHSHHEMQAESRPVLRASDAVWLRRGQRLCEAFLVFYVGALTLAVLAASLMLLALFVGPEAGPEAAAGQSIADLAQ